MKRLLSSLLLVAALFAASAPARASIFPAPVLWNATAAVMFSSGMLDAQAEAAAPTAPTLSFRAMAHNAEALAWRFSDAPLFVLYLLGRASVFHQLADLTGEPPL